MKRYIAGIGLCCALAACNESYPGLYAPVYDADNPNPEMTADSIPVTLSLTDPAYALVTGKRGQGTKRNVPNGWQRNSASTHS